MYTEILKTDMDNPDPSHIRRGASILLDGGLVVFPTETVYGLGADGTNPEACQRIFHVKNRPQDNPLILHISQFDMLSDLTEGIDENLRAKLASIWPAPLTVLLPKSGKVNRVVTGKSPFVAVRMPANRLALDLIDCLGRPIAAPSANISTRPSITDSKHAIEELYGRVNLIYDSGTLRYGIESTIIEVSEKGAVVHRVGSFPVEELERLFGSVTVSDVARGLASSEDPVAPGMKYRHYSPNKPLFVCDDINLFMNIIKDRRFKGHVLAIGLESLIRESAIRCLPLGDNYNEASAQLFSSFRRFEKAEEGAAIIHSFEERGAGLAIMSRIRKAASGTIRNKMDADSLIKNADGYY
ncbi:MAG: L-threonylcarbamoyladenylate synthase [Thermoplasmataceae archaeon]